MLSLLFAAICAANLLPDPSFEQGKWELTRWHHGQAVIELAGAARTGERCVHMKGLDQKSGPVNVLAISPPIDAMPGAEYVFSVWYRTGPRGGAYLSVFTFSRPFEQGEWNSEGRLQYLTRHLAPAPSWRLAIWRFRTAPGTVQMRVAVRLGGLNEAWFDDAALCLAPPASLSIQGRPLWLRPAQRIQIKAAVRAPARQTWTVQARRAADWKLLATAKGSGSSPLSLSLPAAEGDEIACVLFCSGVPASSTTASVPPLIELRPVNFRYRNAVFSSLRLRRLTAELRINAAPGLVRKARIGAALLHASSRSAPKPSRRASGPVVNIQVPAANLRTGRWRLVVTVAGLGPTRTIELPVTVYPPGRPHEVVIDEHNRLLIDGKPFFPRGFYGAPDNLDLLKPISRAGYNAVLTYNRDPQWCKRWLDLCQQAGLWGIVHIPRTFIDKFDEPALRQAIRVVKNHPALLGYYLIDEPSPTRGHTVEKLKRVYDVLADEDPYHPVVICINIPANERLYIDCYDVLMIDVYPVREARQRLAYIAERMDHAWQAVEGRKPVWFIPQTFGYDVVEGLERKTYLTPTPEEEFCMQYLALTHMARGMMAYCYHVYTRYDPERRKRGLWPWVLGGYLPDKQPVLWRALERLGSEYKQFEGALMDPQPACRVLGPIHAAWFRDGRRVWLLVANADEQKPARGVMPAAPDGWPAPRAIIQCLRSADCAVSLRGQNLVLSLPPIGTCAIAFSTTR